MTERDHDALLGRTEGAACHDRPEPVKAVRLHLMLPPLRRRMAQSLQR
jgi:hypothetical protein